MPDTVMKKTGAVLLKTAAIMLITLLLGEATLRVYNYYSPSFVFYSGSYDRFRGKPFGEDWDFKLNSQGFKDLEFTTKKAGGYRILGIGDSFAFGVVPYPYNYLTLVESRLRTGNADVEVLNMGIPSIGPREYLLLLVKEGLALQPDMVLLSFFIGNDLEKGGKRKFYEHSHMLSLIHYLFNVRPEYEGEIIHPKATYCDTCPSFEPEKYLELEYKRSSNYLVNNKRLNRKLDNTTDYLKQMKQICDRHGIALAVAIIPDELQINQALFGEVRRTYYPGTESGQWDITRPNQMLAKALDQAGIDHIDLYEHFSDSPLPLYKPRDTHWNIAGNQLAAEVIEKFLRDNHIPKR